MKLLFISIFALFILIPALSPAEYRVYRLGVKYHPETPGDEEIEVLTTLDHLQYETYYKITPSQQTRLVKHWMCRGRTDYMIDYCPEPLNQKPAPNQSPISSPDLRSPAQIAK